MNWTRILLLSAVCVVWPVCAARATAAQAEPATNNSYEDRNQVDPRPIEVNTVEGSIHDLGKIAFPNASVLLFAEQDHALVASTKSDRNGHFEFGKVKPGLYRLVAKMGALCPANVPLKVAGSLLAHHKIQITMQPQGLDTCSYGTTK